MKPTVLVVIGSMREGRRADDVARWLMGRLRARSEANFELADLRDFKLGAFDAPPNVGPGDEEAWSATVEAADAFIIVTPEYNHGYPAGIKNALDHAYKEWRRKPVGFVSYGGRGAGYRAAEQLRLVAIELQMAPIREQVGVQFAGAAFDGEGKNRQEGADEAVDRMVEDLLWWTATLREARKREEVAV